MIRIFLSSHGKLASGMKNSLSILLGNNDRLHVFDAYVDERNVQAELDAFFQQVHQEDQVILLSDLYGGSVNQVMYTYLERANVHLIAGVNLALLLEIAIREDHFSKEELADLVENSRQMLRLVSLEEPVQSSDDFF